MKLGVSGFAWSTKLSRRRLEELPRLREHGFDGFEIPVFDPADVPAAEVRRAMEAAGLECTVCAILPVGINPIGADPGVRKRSQAHLRRCIETAAEAGAQLIAGPVYAPIGYLPGRRRTAEEWAWAVECLQGLGDALDEFKVTLALEPVNRSETFFLCTAAEAKELCVAVGHARVGITLDTFHANIEEKSIAGAVETAGSLLRHVHASENDRGLLGSGHVDFAGLVGRLRAAGYAGYMTIEGFGYAADEPDSLGALWGDLSVTPEDIAFQGAMYLQRLMA
jgi:D-psicose/D-tagatose/L-ribulose 3-epimerase